MADILHPTCSPLLKPLFWPVDFVDGIRQVFILRSLHDFWMPFHWRKMGWEMMELSNASIRDMEARFTARGYPPRLTSRLIGAIYMMRFDELTTAQHAECHQAVFETWLFRCHPDEYSEGQKLTERMLEIGYNEALLENALETTNQNPQRSHDAQ
jgi:hypothetical protein